LILGALLALMAGVSSILAFGGSGESAPHDPSVSYVIIENVSENVSENVGSTAVAGSQEDTAVLSIAGVVDMAGRPAAVCSLTNPAGCAEPWDGAYDVDSLPAWRWRDIDLDMDSSGGWSKAVQNAFKQIPVTISEIFFHAANFIWMLLLFLMKMGFDAKGLLGIGAQSINTGAAFMADRLLYFIIPLSAYVMWKFLRDFIRLRSGNPFGLMRRLMVFSVLLGLMWMVSSSSKEAITQNVGNTDAQLEQVGTIPWMAKEVLNFGDIVVGPLAGAVIDVDPDGDTTAADQDIAGEGGNLANGPAESAEAIAARSRSGSASCTAYIQAIHSNYARSEDAERALIIVSRLWEGTFYQALKSASFGETDTYRDPASGRVYSSDIPDRVMCHYQEAINDLPAEIQQKIAGIAYGTGAVPAYTKLEEVPMVFFAGNAVKKDDQRKAMTAWAACRWNGSTWDGQPEFNGAWEDSGSENPFKDLCSKAMTQPGNDWEKEFYVFGSKIPESVGQGDAVHQAQLQAARTWGLGYSGANAGGRMIGAFVAFIVSLLFLYSFGLLGLGLTISMMIAVALLALALPAALVLGAIGKTKQATPLFKMTLFSLLGHAFLTALLSIIVIISGIFQNLLGSLPGLPLMIRSLTNGLAPVIAFFIVRKLMKSFGMGDILSPTGALSFAGAAALKGGGSMTAGAQKRMASGDTLKNTPGLGKRLNRLDGTAPTWKNWSPDGRRKRLETNKKQDALERKKRLGRARERETSAELKRREQIAAQMRLDGDDPNSIKGRQDLENRYQQSLVDKPLKEKGRFASRRDNALNKLDKARAPGSVKDRLKNLSFEYEDSIASAQGMGAKAAGAIGLAAIGPVGWAALAGGAAGMGYNRLADDVVRAAATDRIDSCGRPPGTAVGDVEPDPDFSIGPSVSGPGTTEHRTETIRVTGDLIAGKDDLAAAVGAMFASIAASHGVAPIDAGGRVVTVELSDASRDALRHSGALAFGCDPSMVLTTPGGILVPTPISGESRRELENSEHGLGHFVHWLPEEDQERRTITVTTDDGRTVTRDESASEQAARLMVQGIARGAVNPDGTLVDVRSLALGDADTRSSDVIAEIDDWLAGAVNERLENFKLQASDPNEEKLIRAAYEKVRAEERVVVVREVGPALREEEPPVASRPSSHVPAGAGTPAELKETTAQLLVAVNAAKQLFEEARIVGDPEAVVRAAQRMTQTMERLETNQVKLVEGIGLTLTQNLERSLAAQRLRDSQFNANFGKIFEAGVDEIAETIGKVNDALDGFKQGTLGLAGAISALGQTVDSTAQQQQQSVDNLQQALSSMESEAGQKLRDARTGQIMWRNSSARDVATSSGAESLPGDEGAR
jgi:hypothetical protein